MIMHKQFVILLLIKIVEIAAFECENPIHGTTDQLVEDRLKNDLLCNYEKYFLPLKNRSEEMDVQININIDKYWISIGAPATLHLETEITVFWNDVHLKWSPNEYLLINEINIDADAIWKPEIMPQEMELFSNSPSILESSKCKVTSNGSVACKTMSSHYGYCESDVFSWPYNIYECVVQYMLWTQNGEVVNTDIETNKTIQINDKNSEWKIIKTMIEQYISHPEGNIYIAEMFFNFDVRKNMNNSIQLYYISMYTLVALTLLSFWTYFDDTNRMVLILMNILCHFYEMQNFEWHIPTVGHTIPYILAFYRDSLVLAFVQLIETLALKKVMKSKKPIPYLMVLINKIFNRNIIKQILFVQNYKMNDEEDEVINENNLEFIKKYEDDEKREKLQIVDRLFFIIFLTVYFIMTMVLNSL